MSVLYISKTDLTTPKHGREVFTDCWWWEKDGMILDYEIGKHRYPQCNRSERVMEASRNFKLYQGHEPVFIPVAYYPSTKEYL